MCQYWGTCNVAQMNKTGFLSSRVSYFIHTHMETHIYIHMDIGSNYIGTLNILKYMLYPNKYKILKKHRKVAQIPILHHLAWLFKDEDI